MKFMKRIFLFLVINFLVITTVSVVLSLLRLGTPISSYGINYSSLLIFCVVWGIVGSIISLLLSKKIAKWMLGVKIISPFTENMEERELLVIIKEMALNCGLDKTPEIGVYNSNEVNAFATGPSRNNSLIALSKGLLNRMEQDDIKAILAHEISHITNGDMVTMTLLQGIINAFVMFLARILAYAIAGSNRSKNDNFSYLSYALFTQLFQIVFMILGSIGVCAFSRYREYRADAGGAKIAGKEKMINALNSLRIMQEIKDPIYSQAAAAINTFKISNPAKNKKNIRLFATHPSLEDRIERLKQSC